MTTPPLGAEARQPSPQDKARDALLNAVPGLAQNPQNAPALLDAAKAYDAAFAADHGGDED
jgi:hypothetical protein